MSLQVRRRLGLADIITLFNVVIGTVAMAVAVLGEVQLVAQLILLAAVADGLDGIVARFRGGTEVGPFLDSIADIVSFGTTPALFVFVAVREEWGPLSESPELFALAAAVASMFVVFSVLRTALYTVFVGENETRPGIQNTLGGTILAAGYLAGITMVPVLLAATAVLSMLMVAPFPYPKLLNRDAFAMSIIQFGAILVPTVANRLFPRLLLVAALAYLLLAPRYYWGEK